MRKNIVFIILMFLSVFLFAQTKQELTLQLNNFFIEEKQSSIDEFIKKFDTELLIELQSDALIVYDMFSKTSYERFFEISRLFNFIRFYLISYEIQIKNLEINLIIYSFEGGVVSVSKNFLEKYYLASHRKQTELIGNLF